MLVAKGVSGACAGDTVHTVCVLCFSPKLERACVPLPEADGAVGPGGGQVALGAATERGKLQTRPIRGYS